MAGFNRSLLFPQQKHSGFVFLGKKKTVFLAWTRPGVKTEIFKALSDYNINLYITIVFEDLVGKSTITYPVELKV